jgi:hypothetical protein
MASNLPLILFKFEFMLSVRPVIATAVLLLSLVYCGCSKDPEIAASSESRRVVIVVVDGPRYSETWGDPSHQYIPQRFGMAPEGALCINMKNTGPTLTNPGHTAISTGFYQNIDNGGAELPQRPSIFQYFIKAGFSPAQTYIITSKDKLEVLANCTDPNWNNKYRPRTDCGNAGLGTGYRSDSITVFRVQHTLTNNHPLLMLVNFKEPDASGHAADSMAYLQGIKDTDIYVKQIWETLQADPFYKDKTTLIVTNDHGRHTAGHSSGYISHGDNCDGCRRIELLLLGPEVKKNYVSAEPYDQRDIAATVARLLKFDMPTGDGRLMNDLFKENQIP